VISGYFKNSIVPSDLFHPNEFVPFQLVMWIKLVIKREREGERWLWSVFALLITLCIIFLLYCFSIIVMIMIIIIIKRTESRNNHNSKKINNLKSIVHLWKVVFYGPIRACFTWNFLVNHKQELNTVIFYILIESVCIKFCSFDLIELLIHYHCFSSCKIAENHQLNCIDHD